MEWSGSKASRTQVRHQAEFFGVRRALVQSERRLLLACTDALDPGIILDCPLIKSVFLIKRVSLLVEVRPHRERPGKT
jgi:hypothetical protein